MWNNQRLRIMFVCFHIFHVGLILSCDAINYRAKTQWTIVGTNGKAVEANGPNAQTNMFKYTQCTAYLLLIVKYVNRTILY